MKSTLALVLAAAALLAGCKAAAPPSCNDHFALAAKPAITSENLQKRTEFICYEGYAVMHSGISRTPVWSAEFLTAKRVQAAMGMKRQNNFHPDDHLAPADRAELKDYVRSGYDRGHMAPSGDMPTENAQYESFSLANMVPQHPKNNQVIWEGIEEAVRKLALDAGEVYVVTGPVFAGESLERLNGRVLVPSHVYKAIYIPSRGQAAAYLTRNAESMEYRTLSLAELERFAHVDPFPTLSPAVKGAKMALPVPRPHRGKRKEGPVEVDDFTRNAE